MKSKPTFGDVIVVILLSVFALSAMVIPIFMEDNGMYVNITVDGETEIYDILKNAEIKLNSNGHILTVVIEDQSVYVLESNCEDKICVNTGIIDGIGESIVCAPAEIVIFISGGESNVDHIVG